MPHYKKNTLKRIEKFAERIAKLHYEKLSELECTAYVTKEPLPYEQREEGEKKTIALGESWGQLFDCAWFNFTGALPPGYEFSDLVLLINFSGEGLYVDRSGVPVQGLTAGTVAFEYGSMPKHVLPLNGDMLLDNLVNIWIDAGCNGLFGRMIGEGKLVEAHIGLRQSELRSLSYDFAVLKGAMEQLPEDSPQYHSILFSLNAAANEMYDYTNEEAARARLILASELAKKGATPSLCISAIGHAHIDLAWLWPIRETIRKGARTFSTMDRMMDRYPDYKFGVSQPQLLVWMKEHYPQLYERLKIRVAEGRLECQGAMWVEPDTNLAGGEALVRQILYGQRFWQEEFGVTVDNVWLPDVFGYTGSLPGIMKKSGVPYFMTHKLSWNELTNSRTILLTG